MYIIMYTSSVIVYVYIYIYIYVYIYIYTLHNIIIRLHHIKPLHYWKARFRSPSNARASSITVINLIIIIIVTNS